MPRKKRNESWETRVQEVLAEKQTTVELSETLFGPNGLFAQVGQTREQREKLLQHPLYQKAQARLSEVRQAEVARFEADLEAFESPPERLTIQIPRSLHAALRAEAAREGVSLPELVQLKLGFPYLLLAQALASGPATGQAGTAVAS
jgi:hypothetical protein